MIQIFGPSNGMVYGCSNHKRKKKIYTGGTLAVIIFFTGRCDYVGGVTMWEVVRSCGRSVDMYIDSVAKLSIATGHAMQIYNCLNCPTQL